MASLLTVIFFILPGILLYLMQHQTWAKKIGAVVLCYATGLLLGNLNILPSAFVPLQNQLSEITIALALPMLLFTLDVKQWSKVAGKAILSMLLATTSVVTLASGLFVYFKSSGHTTEQLSHLAGMSVGVYTGGTPNLAAIKAGLDIPNEPYLLFHSFDTLIGAVYIALMITTAIPFFRFILNKPNLSSSVFNHKMDNDDDYSPLIKRTNIKEITLVTLLSIFVLLVSVLISEGLKSLLNLQNTAAIIIVLLTSIGIGLSFFKKIRTLELAYKMGMYLILVFCLTVASMAKLDELLHFDPVIAIFLCSTVFGSIALHALLCKLTRVDSDTFMVTSVSAICSPPFVPIMAKALGNPNVILSGMTTGIIGYALGNYLGISLALFLQTF